MTKITKEFLINQALEKYSENQINNAYHCNVKVTNKDGISGELNIPLNNRGKKTKTQKIKGNIRSFLLNITPDESNKRYNWDTSSENIESIEIKLNYKIDDLGVNIKKNGRNSYTNISFVEGNIITLIGENGSGKSTILESVLENGLYLNNGLFISYSSGLNESFSSILKPYIEKNRKLTIQGIENDKNENILNGFYFNKSWVGILIFLAYSLKNNGKVKNFLRLEKNEYLILSEDPFIQFDVKIEKTYIDKLNSGTGEHKSLETTDFHIMLDKLLNNLSLGTLWTDKNGVKSWGISEKRTYDFDKAKKLTSMVLKSDDVKDIFGNNGKKILYYLGLLTNNNYFIDVNDIKLYFNNGINLNNLSDGEFQLLMVYALIDLFDSKETIFLFDEVDSHLHYKNINKLWENLGSIQGKLITTTHIPDSIINNEIKQIKVVKDGIIDDDNTVNSLINRLGNISDTYLYEKKLASKVENIVLVDDCTDWFIFKELAKIKKGSNYDDKIEGVQSIKCNSGFNGNPNEIFGEKKLNWINEFILKNNSFKTKKIFSLCDKDECPIAKIDDDMKFKEYHTGDNKKTQNFGSGGNIYYLSWKRREIENYFLSYTLLNEYGLLDDVNNLLPPARKIRGNNSLDYNEIQVFQAKEVVQKFAQKELNGKFVWKDYTELKEIISMIPADEISEDIEKMYDFIISKI